MNDGSWSAVFISWYLRAVALPVALKTTGYSMYGESCVFGELWVGASETCNALRAINTRIWWVTDQIVLKNVFYCVFPRRVKQVSLYHVST